LGFDSHARCCPFDFACVKMDFYGQQLARAVESGRLGFVGVRLFFEEVVAVRS